MSGQKWTYSHRYEGAYSYYTFPHTSADGLLEDPTADFVNKKGGRPMLNNPRSNQPQFSKHVCIFELERKGGLFTAEVVCTMCGGYLSSQQEWPPGKDKAAQGPKNQRIL